MTFSNKQTFTMGVLFGLGFMVAKIAAAVIVSWLPVGVAGLGK